MTGFAFYLEHDTKAMKHMGRHAGNVFALDLDIRSRYGAFEGAGAVFYRPNSPVQWTGTNLAYLTENCKEISEQEARMIHPELFAYLEQGE